MPIIYHQHNTVIYKDLNGDCSISTLTKARESVVGELFDTKLLHKPSGAPFLADNAKGRFVSISHTDCYLALAYSMIERCGIDIELVTRDAARVSRKFTSNDEIEIVRSSYPKNPELLVWCAKEALYKMCEIEGAEFKTDFNIVSIGNGEIECLAFGKRVSCIYFEIDNLLIVKTLCRK